MRRSTFKALCFRNFLVFSFTLLFSSGSMAWGMAGNAARSYEPSFPWGQFFVTIVILIVLFLLLREVNCWYWKINERLSVLEEIRDLLKQGESNQHSDFSDKPASPTPSSPKPNPPAPTKVEQVNLPLAPKDTQLRVTKVAEKSYGERVGIKPGDILSRINNTKVRCDRDLTLAIKEAQKKEIKIIEVELIRDGQSHIVTAPLVKLGISCSDEEIG